MKPEDARFYGNTPEVLPIIKLPAGVYSAEEVLAAAWAQRVTGAIYRVHTYRGERREVRAYLVSVGGQAPTSWKVSARVGGHP